MTKKLMSMANLLLMGCLAVCIVSCNRRELTYDYRPYCNVRVETDWSEFGELPTGMTLMFYPTDGGEPVTVLTNRVETTSVKLKAGEYHVLAHNLSYMEFARLGFRGMNCYETAEAYVVPAETKWYSPDKNELVAREPNILGTARYEGFSVTDNMVRLSRDSAIQPGSEPIIRLKPRRVVETGSVDVKVKGIHNVKAVRGAITGMAGNFFLGENCVGESPTTHILDEWEVAMDEGSKTEGSVRATFSTFGLPLNSGAGRAKKVTINHYLFISFLLKDNSTQVDFQFLINNHIKENRDGLTLIVDIGNDCGIPNSDPGCDDPNMPVVLPDVEISGDGGGGFDVDVGDWDDETNVDVIL